MAARVNKDEFEGKVLKSDIPVLVDFYSDSCVPCKKMTPVIGDVEDDMEGKLAVYKVILILIQSLQKVTMYSLCQHYFCLTKEARRQDRAEL